MIRLYNIYYKIMQANKKKQDKKNYKNEWKFRIKQVLKQI